MDIARKIEAAKNAGKLSNSAYQNIQAWLTQPKYQEYQLELNQLIASEDWPTLEDNFFKVVPFGTGGRRGTVGVGSNRINRVTMGESAQGMANYLLSTGEQTKKAGVAIGYDTRLTSQEFVEFVATVFAANGFRVYLFSAPRPTPELSLAVRHLAAAAGVVISASHNPPSDNGFKAYWQDGGQIVPPHDANIMDHVAKVAEIHSMDFEQAKKQGLITMIGPEIDQAYINAMLQESLVPNRSAAIVYSPLHGTGTNNVLAVLKQAGFNVTVVDEQATPDGAFPNAPNHIPNPEVPSASELATQYAQNMKADIAITTDPDADRLGVVARDSQGNYQFLNGNQIATLIGYFVLDQLKQQAKLKPNQFMVKTIVTTDFLDAFSQAYGLKMYNHILIGFKYVAELIKNLEGKEEFVFGGEESHGILKGSYTRDKDAGIAALLIAELASYLKDKGQNLVGLLDELYTKYGVYWETLHNVLYPGAEGSQKMADIMAKLRQQPPIRLGKHKVYSIIDRLKETFGGIAGDVIILNLSEDKHTRVTIRPSGTEPKLKIYTQVYIPVTNDLAAAKKAASELANELQAAAVNLVT